MAKTTQRFNFDEAQKLEGKLNDEIGFIKDKLNKTQQKVGEVDQWWKGGSEKAFIENFASTKNEVVASLEKWLQEYQQLIQKVAKVKRDQDDSMARALKR